MARKGYKTASFTLPDGTRKYVYAKTQEELDEKVFNLKLQMKMGVKLNDKTTVGELIKMWYATDLEGKIKPSTAISIKTVINNHVLPLVSSYVAKDVTPVQVKMWINEFDKLNKVAANNCLRSVREAFELAEENGLIYKSPVLSRYKSHGRPYGKREALSPDQEVRLIGALEDERARMFVRLALATGMRRGELLGLMWDCVDLDEKVIRVRRSLVVDEKGHTYVANRTKTPAGVRDLPITNSLCADLRVMRSKSKSVYVLTQLNGNVFSSSGFSVFWSRHVQRYADFGRPVTPHVLRHTFCTRCFEAGMDIAEVQYLMGHESPAVTMEVYTHYCKESRLSDTFDKVRTARKCTADVPHNAVETG